MWFINLILFLIVLAYLGGGALGVFIVFQNAKEKLKETEDFTLEEFLICITALILWPLFLWVCIKDNSEVLQKIKIKNPYYNNRKKVG